MGISSRGVRLWVNFGLSGGRQILSLELLYSLFEKRMSCLIDRNVCVDAHLLVGLDDRTKEDVFSNLRIAGELVREKVHKFLSPIERLARGDVRFRVKY